MMTCGVCKDFQSVVHCFVDGLEVRRTLKTLGHFSG